MTTSMAFFRVCVPSRSCEETSADTSVTGKLSLSDSRVTVGA